MSHAQKVSFNDALTGHIDDYAERQGLPNFTDAVRELVVLGLAVDYQRRNLTLLDNPYLHTSPELTRP